MLGNGALRAAGTVNDSISYSMHGETESCGENENNS